MKGWGKRLNFLYLLLLWGIKGLKLTEMKQEVRRDE